MKKLMQFYRNMFIRRKIVLMTFVIMTAVSGISLIAVNIASKLYENKIYQEAAEVLNLSSTSVDNELKRIERLSFQILSDAKIQEYLMAFARGLTEYEWYRTKDDLLLQLLNLSQQEKYISSITMIDAMGSRHTLSITDQNNYIPENLAARVIQASGSNIWMPSIEDNVLITAKQIRQIKNLDLRHLGIVIIYIDMNRLIRQSLDLSEDKLFLIEYMGTTIYSSNPDLSENWEDHPFPRGKGYDIVTLDGTKYFVTHLSSALKLFSYLNVINYNTIFYQMQLIKTGQMLLYTLVFVVALNLSHAAARSITRPLEAIANKMKLVQKGNFNTEELFPESNVSMDEIGQIHRHFRLMLERINELIRENYAKQLAIKEAEYKALQAQINPHFLYNTLESINWMAKINKQTQISETVEALGNLLRAIIGNKHALITLGEEMAIVDNYITIQKVRFGDRLEFVRQELGPLDQYYIPKLSIQPIVENVVRHVLEEVSTPCRIELSILAEEDYMEITVADNGPGISEETLAALRTNQVQSKGTGIGIANIHERIQLLFGDEYGVTVKSEQGSGTSVRIRIPYCLEG
mgnify:CR=1 FL=1